MPGDLHGNFCLLTEVSPHLLPRLHINPWSILLPGLGEEEGSWEAPNQSPTTSKDGLFWSDPCEKKAAKIYRQIFPNSKSDVMLMWSHYLKKNKKLKKQISANICCAMFLSQSQRCQVVFSGFLRFFWDFSIFTTICTWMMGKSRILGVSTTKTDATLLTAMASRILPRRLPICW